MSSSSILMNLPAATPAVPSALVAQAGSGAEQAMAGVGGFDQALAAAQLGVGGVAQVRGAEPSSLAMIAALLAGAVPADEREAPATSGIEDDAIGTGSGVATPDAGAAAILAQMLLGSSPAAPADKPVEATPELAATGIPAQPDAPGVGTARRTGNEREVEESSGDSAPADAAEAQLPAAIVATAAEDAVEPNVTGGPAPAASTPQAGSATQALVQAAAVALRDAAPAASNATPAHLLREPVGTARWADELGNRLVLMSVRGQQQGSLMLTPEHLGPVEVQISVSKDTANVWFGAAHADTRVALSEAMPRLRELLAASGLSLGQAGVSEQAPREAFAPPAPGSGSTASRAEAETTGEVTAPAWRAWRPGLLDTYA